MYRVLIAFIDMEDNGHVYNAGDQFPRPGIKVREERLEELSSNLNKAGVALIVDESTEERPSEARGGVGEVESGVDSSDSPEAKERPKKRKGK